MNDAGKVPGAASMVGFSAASPPAAGADGVSRSRVAMPLVAKIGLALVLAVGAMAAVLAWVSREVVLARFAATEAGLVARNRGALQSVINGEIAHLRLVAAEWGERRELLEIARRAQGRTPATEPGLATLDRLGLDLLVVMNRDGSMLIAHGRNALGSQAAMAKVAADSYAASAGWKSNRAYPHRHDRGRPAASSGFTALAGVADSPAGPIVVSTQPLASAAASATQAGLLVMARTLDAAGLSRGVSVLPSVVYVHGSAAGSRMPASIHAVARRLATQDASSLLVTRDDDMSDFTLFRDLAGRPAFVLETQMPRNILAAGRDTTNLLSGLVLASALIFLLMAAWLVRRIVNAPLAALTGRILDLRDGRRIASPAPSTTSDEIGVLSREFDALIRERDQGREELERLAAAVGHAADAIAILDAEGRIQYVNPQYECQTGYTSAEVVGRAPGRGESGTQVYDDLWKTVRAGSIWTGVLRSRRRSGENAEEEVTVAPIAGPDGRPTSFIAVMRDITRRRATESELRRLVTAVEYSAEGIVILNAAGCIEYVNPAYERMRRVRRADVMGKRLGSSARGTDAAEHYKAMFEKVRSGLIWSGRINSQFPDGTEVTEEVVVSPVLTGANTIEYFVIVMHDVTGNVRLEEQLAQARKLEAIGQLAAGVAHEINTPTQYLGDNIRFLREAFERVTRLIAELSQLARQAGDGAVPAERLDAMLAAADVGYLQVEVPIALDQSIDGVERVTEIVRSMKELSHPARDVTPTDLNRLVRNALTVAGNEWKYVADLEASLATDLPPVSVVPGSISQVFVNVLVNAAHAVAEQNRLTGRNKGRITVETRQRDGKVEVSVCDNGTGMESGIKARVFDPFFTTKPVGKGTGQGLAIAHRIVEKHGGSITVDSTPGGGACFVIALPLAPLDATARVA